MNEADVPTRVFEKEPVYNRITISDDRSTGSKIEDRNLLALRGRETKTQEREVRQRSARYLEDIRKEQITRELQALQQHENKKLVMGQQELDQTQEVGHVVSNSSAAMDVNAVASDMKQVLDQADSSKVDLRELKDYIELLRAQARELKSIQDRLAPSRYQIIHRIQRLERNGNQREKRYVPYFDHPEWVGDHGTANDIKSNVPLTNFELYLEKNRDISFIVYRNFDKSASSTSAPGTDNESHEIAHRPYHTNETVRLVNKDLIKAIKTLLGSQQYYAELARAFSVSLELPAPYLFIYYSRKDIEKFQDSLSM